MFRRILLYLFWLVLYFSAHSAVAVEISGNQITPSSTLRGSAQFTLPQIVDGITDDVYTKPDGTRSHNGFASRSGQPSIIRLTLDNEYDLNTFRIWNDINVRAEGVKTFSLIFRDNQDRAIAERGPFETTLGQMDVQVFDFETVPYVKHVDLNITDFVYQIEIREVAFEGEPSQRGNAGVDNSTDGNVAIGGGSGVTINVNVNDVLKDLFGNKKDKEIRPENKAPIALDDRFNFQGVEGAMVVDPTQNDTDPDGDSLEITEIENVSPGLNVERSASNNIALSTTIFNQDHSFSYVISDGKGATDRADVIYRHNQVIDLPDPNRNPVAINDSLALQEGATVNFNPLSNDTDMDGDALSITAIRDVSSDISAQIEPTNTIKITASSALGDHFVTYEISDGQGGTDTGRISVTVERQQAEPNRSPMANNDDVTLKRGMEVSFNPLSNDTDPDGDILTLTNVEAVDTKVTAQILSSNMIKITASNAAGQHFVTYDITDGKDGTNTGYISVIVQGAPLPKLTAKPDIYAFKANEPQIIEPLKNDEYAESARISRIINNGDLEVTRISDTTLSVATGTATGSQEFGYEISDASGLLSSSTIKINIAPNTPPQANDDNDSDTLTLALDSQINYNPLSNDTDADGDILYISDISNIDPGLTVTLIDPQNIQINSSQAHGIKHFTYHIEDGKGGSDQAQVTVKIPANAPGPQPPDPSFPILPLIIGGLLLSLPVAYLMGRRKRPVPPTQTSTAPPVNKQRSWWIPPIIPTGQPAPKPEKPPESGIVFPKSPMLAGALVPGPAPLAPLGQMIPSGLQTLTGQYAALKPAYLATGRIGGPQEGKPTNDDVAFGTGFLITPNHIMTNQHVYEFYKHYLTGPECGGIEFIAERDRDASDYVPFDGKPPVILPDLDIAIFTLARAVTDRKPIDRIAVPTEELDGREVVTVSYPCPFEVDDVILSVVEKDPIFAVKRLSQGRVFRHTTDTDTPFGVQVNVDARINPKKSLLAICHNASTLGGSSGAPVLDRGGNLVGVHFAGDRAFNGEEAANLAMAIEMLAEVKP